MFTVKISTNFEWKLERQTPRNSGVWGNCRFIVNQDIEECDFWVVIDGVTKKESTRCPSGNTLLITGEPPDVKGYGRRFLAQFDSVITCNRSLVHPRICYSHQGLPWMIGAQWNAENLTWNNFMSFEQLSRPVANKTKLLSVIASTKNATNGHVARSEFIEMLISEFGTFVDVYGHGRNPIIDKWDAIAPYKYHVAIENSVVPDYWTEKLSDALIGEALPIYHGCPNIRTYFSSGAIQTIDIRDPQTAITRIKDIIRNDLWHYYQSDIISEKYNIMNLYNIFSILNERICSSAKETAQKSSITLKPEYATGSKVDTLVNHVKKLFISVQ